MCFFNLNRFYIKILKNNIDELLEELRDYKQLYFKVDDKLRELRTYIKDRKEELNNAGESINNICVWHYEMLINHIDKIVNRK